MYNRLTIARKYLHYYLTAQNGRGHGIHSPFIFDFVKNVLNDGRYFYAYREIEQLRQLLLHNNTPLQVEDFGAGSATGAHTSRSIKDITRHAAKSPKYARLLYRLVNYYGCRNIIELGTSMGISAAYMAAANNFGRVITCEGSPAVARQAQENFRQLWLQHITVLTGPFASSFPLALAGMPQVDLLFIDGNHRKAPTLEYFETALPCLHNNSILVFDDIHWSREMEEAWAAIKQHNAISETVDLFFLGIVFFRKEQQARQHFTIRF